MIGRRSSFLVLVAAGLAAGFFAAPADAAKNLVSFSGGRDISSSPIMLSGGKDYTTTVWFGWQTLVVELANRGHEPAQVAVQLLRNPSSAEWGNSVAFTSTLAPGGSARWRIPLLYLTYSKGARRWPSQGALTNIMSRGRIRPPLEVGSIAVALTGTVAGAGAVISRMELADPHPLKGWVDRFGQNGAVDWRGKVKSDGALAEADKLEVKELAASPPPADRDRYQAWTGKPARNASGFFRLEKVDGVWWLVAPDGNLFYSQGLDCVWTGGARLDSVTRPAFSWLPPDKGKFAAAWGDAHGAVKNETEPRWPSFQISNLIRKWGPEKYDVNYRERALARLIGWGFTTIGNWSDPNLVAMRRMPYVTTGPETWKLWDKVTYAAPNILDAFHPKFESFARDVCAEMVRFKDDPMCVGHFLENEIYWDALPEAVLGLEEGAPAKARLIKELKRKYVTIKALNVAWGTTATGFGELRWPEDREPTKAALKDMGKFMGEFTDRWYGAWARGMREADPHHLLLGDRFAMEPDWEEILVSCGKHMDVVSINYYAHELPRETFDKYYAKTGKPMLIGEYGFDSVDEGLLTAAVTVANQEERAEGYRYYTERTAAIPYIIGAHYFQYWDEPVTGRFDRETGFNGFVRVTDNPYAPLVKAARESNGKIYRIHAGEVAPGGREPRI